jgi:hypothetical protein
LPRGADERIDHQSRGAVERSRSARQHDASRLLRLTAYGEDHDAVGQWVEHDRSDGRDREAGGDDPELGEPIAHDIADVGSFSQARPHPEQRVAGIGSACHPDLSCKL